MYGFTTRLTDVSFDQAVARTIAALKAEGFGVLSDIDVQRTMKDKLGVAVPPYRILGACNPSLAHEAMQAEADIGMLLPCNVIVREEPSGSVVVGFLDPQIMVGLVGKPEVKSVADQAEQRLRRACASLGGGENKTYLFKSKAAGDVLMLRASADQLLRIIGKEPAAKGIIEAAALPAAIQAIENAVAQESAHRTQGAKAEAAPDRTGSEGDAVSLRQRAWPLLEMMKAAHAAAAEIVWGV